MSTFSNKLKVWWNKIGSVAASALAIAGLITIFHTLATANINRRLDSVEAAVADLTNAVELSALAIAEPDSLLKREALTRLRMRHIRP